MLRARMFRWYSARPDAFLHLQVRRLSMKAPLRHGRAGLVRKANDATALPMADIATIMFGKAIVLTVGAWTAERYHTFKAKRRVDGVVLRYDAKRGIHYDPLLRLERRAKLVLRIAGACFALYAIFVVAVLIGPPLMAAQPG